jgi:hypothetical protein
MKTLFRKIFATVFATAALLLIVSVPAFAQANIIIQNADSAGAGFNDTTAATPVGGNTGTTVGAQRFIAFQTAASIWGAALKSSQTITIHAGWSALSCTANSGTLGSAGNAGTIWKDFSGAPVAGHWYGNALANALSGSDLNMAAAEINATFNSSISSSSTGTPGCLESAHWYYGLDNNHGSSGIDLVSVLLHEFSHGLGFQSFANTSTGVEPGGTPGIFDKFLFDNTTNKTWDAMTDGERQASAINTGKLVWIGPQVVADVPRGVLAGTAKFRVNSPASISGNYQVGTADFGPLITSAGVTGTVVQSIPNDGCSTITNAVAGNLVLIDRGNCLFTVKAHNAQDAGAIGVIIVDNDPANNPPPGLGGGPDNTITIPSVRITTADGNTIKAKLASPGVNASLFSDPSRLAGTDTTGRPLMYTPSTLASGSSVSHWDTTLFPDQLMEPNISGALVHSVRSPIDLTLSLLRDIGWPINLAPPPAILTEQGTTLAGAVDSVTFVHGPFTVTTANNFSSDGRRRLIIFTTPELPANPTITVTANGIPLTVENAGIWNALAGTSYIVVVLPNLSPGSYSLSVTINSVSSSNTPTITIQ